MPGVRGLGHINLRASTPMIERLRRFYIDIVGLSEGPRPAFRSGSHGHWLYAADTDVLHLTVADDEFDAEPRDTGWFNHLAFDCDDLDTTRQRLDAADIDYAVDMVDALHQVQLFLTDPAGIKVELTFAHGSKYP